MWTRRFWKSTAERAVKTAFQALLGYWVGDQVFNAWSVNWHVATGVTLGGGLLSLVTSLASIPIGNGNSPSVVIESVPRVKHHE